MKRLVLIISATLFSILSNIFYAQTTFTGVNSNDWHDPGNWDNGLPIFGNDPTIPAGKTAENSSEIQNSGSIHINGTLYNAGSIINTGDMNNVGTIVNVGEITNSWTITNNGTITNDGIVANEGIIGNFLDFYNYGTVYNCIGTLSGNLVLVNSPEESSCPSQDVCDGADNDLDGLIDEDCGCTDSMALNYNSLSTLDDGSCTYMSDLTVTDIYGNTNNLGAISDTAFVFIHFMADWTPIDPLMVPEIMQAFELYGCNQEDVYFIAINSSTNGDVSSLQFALDNGYDVPIVSQDGGSEAVQIAFGVYAFPTLVLVDQNGLIVNDALYQGPGSSLPGIQDEFLAQGIGLFNCCTDTDMDGIYDCSDTEECDGLDNDGDGEVDEGCGCTDAMALNYNSVSTLDDGSCTYMSDLTVTDIYGNTNNLGAISDTAFVFIHFMADWTPYDPLMVPEIMQAYELYGCNQKDVYFIAINSATNGDVSSLQFALDNGYDVPIVSQDGGSVAVQNAFGVYAFPTLVLVDQSGLIVNNTLYQGVGSSFPGIQDEFLAQGIGIYNCCTDADLDGIYDCADTEECDGLDNDGDGEVDEGCGCIDSFAINYNSLSTLDDGSCTYMSDLTVTDIYGNTNNLGAISDTAFVFIHFMADWTPYDPLMVPEIMQAYQLYGCNQKDVYFIAINSSTNGDVSSLQFAVDNGYDVPIVSEDGGSEAVRIAFGVSAFPTLVLVNQNGSVVNNTLYQGVGASLPGILDEFQAQGIVEDFCGTDACTDPLACNYQPIAINDDGSCIYLNVNDDCANAIAILSGETVVADNSCTVIDGPEPSCGAEPGENIKDLWWTYTSLNGENILISTELNGTSEDSRLAVYDACGGTEIACNDDLVPGVERNAQIYLETIAGETYYIQSGGWAGVVGSYDISISIPNNGCDDPAACNYDPMVDYNDGSCVYPGCIYALACNYDSTAGCDDGSCLYRGTCEICSSEIYCLYDVIGDCSIPDDLCQADYASELGLTSSLELDQKTLLELTVTFVTSSCVGTNFDIILNGDTIYTEFNDNCLCNFPTTLTFSGLDLSAQIEGDNLLNFVWDNEVLISTLIVEVISSNDNLGCTDALACNYNPLVICDDNSCVFPGCSDVTACNFDSLAGCDDGSCTYAGCTDISACNYNQSAACDDGSCEYMTCRGCTGELACNFNSSATIDDGSCEYESCSGCTYFDSLNFNPLATVDDGSCNFVFEDNCPADINGDLTVNTSDLLALLGNFGAACP